MGKFEAYKEELTALENGKSEYEWDELEELITDDFDEDRLSSDEFDRLMEQLMAIDCE